MILLIPLIVSFAVVQAADAASAGQDPPGTSELRGRVTDKETGLAIARAVVELHVVGWTETLTTLTDDEGRYEFVGLRPAQYEGFVSAGESRATHLMQPLRDTDGRRSIALGDGEVRKDVNIALPRALAMTVRVIDEWGEPLSGLRIALKSAGSGREVHGGFSPRTTDDRGRLRLFALPADSYVVCAEPEHIGSGAGNESSRLAAERITLSADEERTVDLRVAGAR